jgi:hypothetical protein
MCKGDDGKDDDDDDDDEDVVQELWVLYIYWTIQLSVSEYKWH